MPLKTYPPNVVDVRVIIKSATPELQSENRLSEDNNLFNNILSNYLFSSCHCYVVICSKCIISIDAKLVSPGWRKWVSMRVLRNQSQKIALLKINILVYGEYTTQIARLTKRLALYIYLDCVEVLFKILGALIQLFTVISVTPSL